MKWSHVTWICDGSQFALSTICYIAHTVNYRLHQTQTRRCEIWTSAFWISYSNSQIDTNASLL